MSDNELCARLVVVFGLVGWGASICAMALSPPFELIYPHMQTYAFTASIATQGVWVIGFLWVIYERVKVVKK